MSNADVLIQVKDLYKVFGDKPEGVMPMVKAGKSKDEILAETGHTVGLKEIDLEIKRGEIFVIMGLSGSGKSTLIRHFNRLIEPTAGEIIVEGTDVMKLNTKELEQFRRHKMSMVFQRFGLMPHYTVLDNVAYGLKIQGVDKSIREQKAVEWLETVGLKGYEEQYPNQLSGGQQQRVGLARALCTDAEILLMDEAFSALDPLIRSEMQDQLIELQHKLNKTIIFITHDLDEALRLGDRIAILKDGLLVQQGEPEEILLHPADEYVEAFVKDVNRARALTVETVMKEPEHRITAETIGEALKEMKKGAYDYGHVVDDSGSYQGTVTQEWLEEEAKGGNADSTWEEADLTETTTITSDAVLETVIPETLEADHPIPVVDEEGQLQGELSRSSLAEVLVDSSETESESEENQKA